MRMNLFLQKNSCHLPRRIPKVKSSNVLMSEYFFAKFNWQWRPFLIKLLANQYPKIKRFEREGVEYKLNRRDAE